MTPLIVIANLIQQSAEILAAITKLEITDSADHVDRDSDSDLIDTAITHSKLTTIRIGILLERLATKHSANLIIALLKEKKVDYTLLLYMQLPGSLHRTSEVISYLDSICANMKIDTTSRRFYECVWTYFEHEGIAPITPDKYVTATKKNLALEEYETVKKSWGSHSPLFLQTYTTREGKFVDNIYYISRTAQDGIIWFLDVLKAGSFMVRGRAYDVCGAFEHVISPSTLTCQIYDCEIMSKAFGDTKSVEEIKEMVLCFPQCISSIMIEYDLINIEDLVTFVAKDRTRQVDEGNFKVSNHFIGNICAPKFIHRHATDICLQKWKAKIDEVALSVKSSGLIPEGCITNGIYDSILTLDYSAIKSNGFTTAFSRKTPRDPFPRMLFADEVCAGEVYARHECLKEPHDLLNPDLSDAQRRMLIYTQLYTPPKKEMLCYTEDAMEAMMAADTQVFFYVFFFFGCPHRDSNPITPEGASTPVRTMAVHGVPPFGFHVQYTPSDSTLGWGQEKGGAALKPAPRPQRASDSVSNSSSHNLPAWLLSDLQEATGQCVSDVRSDLPFLHKLKDTLPEAARGATLYHIPRTWCAKYMTLDEVHVHKSNGTIFAVGLNGEVYATCSTGSHKITECNSQCIKVVNMYSRMGEDGKPQAVESVKGKCVHWVMIDEESMRLLVKEG